MNKQHQNKLPAAEDATLKCAATLSLRATIDNYLSRSATAVVVILGVALVATPASAAMYKWVDASGNISYQDRPPPADYEESSEVLNKNGVTVETIPSRVDRLENERLAKISAAERQRDDALIQAFPNESDLTSTRDKRVSHIDGSVARLYDQLIVLNKRLGSVEDKIKVRVERNLSPKEALETDRTTILGNIESIDALIKTKLQERRLVISQFDVDLIRYREIKSGSATASYND